jgi:hypothetical protein
MIKTRNAAAAVAAFRLLAFTPTGDAVTATPGSAPMAASGSRPSAAGGRIDMILSGPVTLVAGAAVQPGDPLAADALGRAVPAPAGSRYGAFAMEAAAPDEQFLAHLQPGFRPA